MSICETHPELVKRWHPTKNASLEPKDVSPNSMKYVWWMCPKSKHHDDEIRIKYMVKRKNKCSYCTNRKACIDNCLETLYPLIAKEWHPTKNMDLSPSDVTCGTEKVVFWKCLVDPSHEWDMNVYKRVVRKQNCPFCANVRINNSNCLKTLYPEIAEEWHETKNGSITPNNVSASYTNKVWWLCKTGNLEHEWDCTVIQRTKKQGTGCPFCSGQRVCSSNCLLTTHPNTAKRWHPTKNKLTPKDVTHGQRVNVWWLCAKCNEEEYCSINIASASNKKCGFCSNRKVSKHNNLQATHPMIAKLWHPTKNELTPDKVTPYTVLKVWWLCDTCDDVEHEWEAKIRDMVTRKNLKGKHPGRQICTKDCLSTTHPELSKEWNPTKNILYPTGVTHGQGIKVWWKCRKCKFEWNASINGRCQGSGCPKCSKRNYSTGSITWLNRIQEQKKIKIKHILNGGEFLIKIPGYKRGAFVDGYCNITNTVYEYLGCMYHGHHPNECIDKKKYYPTNKNPINKKTYKELYKDTFVRLRKIKRKGYNIVIIWECKYLHSVKRQKQRKKRYADENMYDLYDLDTFMYS